MSGRWYKRCGADFIHGTMNLTLEEKGAYSLCLDLIYDRGAPIPDDARWLSGVCGVSMRKWNSLRQSLIDAGKLTAENGFLTNNRAALEIVSAELQRRNQAETGAKGGRKRAENERTAKENSDLDQGTLKPIEERRGELPLPKGNGDSDVDFWSNAKAYLKPYSKNPGALIGKWCSGGNQPLAAKAITEAQVNRAVDPIPYIEKVLRQSKTSNGAPHIPIGMPC